MKRFAPFLWLGVALAPGACVYDADHRCGPNQQLISNDRCTCVAGYVPGPTGCVPCPDNEEESAGACQCVAGYSRAAPDAECKPVPNELGKSCDVDQPCRSSEYPECHVASGTSGTSGYCTSTGCKTSRDCAGGYMCQTGEGASYCRRPAQGQGKACTTDADCADTEAKLCELLQAHVCVVSCTPGGNECFEGEVCCDLTSFGGGVLCTPDGKCPTQGAK